MQQHLKNFKNNSLMIDDAYNANPEGSLKELLFALDNKISKGALAQRFDKILKLAEELGDNDGK